MTPDRTADETLDDLFGAARGNIPTPSNDFLARCTSAALDAQSSILVASQGQRSVDEPHLFERILGNVGHIWRQALGAGLAACIGLAIGYQSPDLINGGEIVADVQFGLSDLMPEYELALWEDLDQ